LNETLQSAGNADGGTIVTVLAALRGVLKFKRSVIERRSKKRNRYAQEKANCRTPVVKGRFSDAEVDGERQARRQKNCPCIKAFARRYKRDGSKTRRVVEYARLGKDFHTGSGACMLYSVLGEIFGAWVIGRFVLRHRDL
jgi:hypothetical protein